MSYSLYLYPKAPVNYKITQPELLNYLLKLEFMEELAESGLYYPGNKLMDYITFLGCSPSLKTGEIESTIKLHFFNTISGMGGESVEKIRYPDCKHPVHDPSSLLKSYSSQNSWLCPVCSNRGRTEQIQWRRTAGFSNIFIEVSQIFPKEAVPSDKLLESLTNATKTEWLWFYSKTSH